MWVVGCDCRNWRHNQVDEILEFDLRPTVSILLHVSHVSISVFHTWTYGPSGSMYTLLLSTSGGTNWIEPASALQELHLIYPILFAAWPARTGHSKLLFVCFYPKEAISRPEGDHAPHTCQCYKKIIYIYIDIINIYIYNRFGGSFIKICFWILLADGSLKCKHTGTEPICMLLYKNQYRTRRWKFQNRTPRRGWLL